MDIWDALLRVEVALVEVDPPGAVLMALMEERAARAAMCRSLPWLVG
jgi:hypothetical protein